MAKNKAANITSLGTYLYKNIKYKELNGLPSKGKLKQYIRIPLLSNINDGVISKMSTVSMNGITCYRISEDADQTSVLDFGDNSITFMNCSQFQGNNIIGCFDPNIKTYNSEILNNVNMSYYGAGYPNLKGYSQYGRPDINYVVFNSFFSEWTFPSNDGPVSFPKMFKPLDFSRNFYVGNNLLPLSTMYDGENDCFLLPEVRSSAPIYEKEAPNINDMFYPDKDCSFAYNIYKEGIGSIGLTPEGAENYMNTVFNGYRVNGFSYPDPDANSGSCYIRMNSYSFSGGAKIYIRKDDVDNIVFGLNFNNILFSVNQALSTYAFIYDDENNDIYILLSGYSSDNKVLTYIFPVKACKNYVATGFAPSDISTDFNTNDFILSLLGTLIDEDNIPVPAPDAYGPGNPYQDTNNAGSSIGGNFDFNDVIETNDATPNTGFDTFDYQTSLFGTYIMSNKNIKDYTHTLNLLYEHSADILFGSVASAMAGRIVDGTTGLFSLPITIPSTNYTNTTFAIGNTGIADENATYAELSAGNFTTAKYLTKNMIEYTIDIDPIKHRYDNFLDFPPYSSASIYIPYIGTQELPLGIIQSTSQYTNTLKLKVRVDVPTGDFVVILFSNGVPITHWNGNCARTIQLAVNDNSQIIRNISNQISKAAGAIGIGAMTGGAIGAASQVLQTVAEEGIQSQTPISTTQHKIGNIQNSGVSGWMDNQQFYIIVERPVMYLPYNYGHHIGYPTDKVVRIGSCKGFCQFGEVHIECSANQAEKDEIIRVLQKGVILNVS